MEKQATIEQARALISDAEVGKAIDLVEDFLKNDHKYRRLYAEALRLSAQQAKTKQDEVKGTVSFDNVQLSYSQVNDGLLQLLGYLENDELDPPSLRPAATLQSVYQSNKWLFLAGLPTLVLAIVVLVLVFQKKDDQPVELPEVDPEDCAIQFLPNAFPKILVLPFFRPTGGEIRPDGLIAERLETFSSELQIMTDVELCSRFQPGKLLNYDEAEGMGRLNACNLVIWGRAEREKVNGDFVVKTRFKFLDLPDTIPSTNLRWQGEKQIDTVKVLSIMTSNGELTSDIETTMLLLLGMAADQAGNSKSAIAALESIRATDSASVVRRNMMLAENYLRTGQSDKALSAYDSLLKVKPNYWLAENNRGVLRASQGDYLGAITDFTDVLAKRPTDAETRLARGMAYKMSEQLKQAIMDMEAYIKMSPKKSSEVEQELQKAKQEVRALERKVEPVKDKPIHTLNQTQVQEAAEASRKLGDNQAAQAYTEKALSFNPDDPKYIANYIEVALREGNVEKAQRVFADAVKQGVNRKKILDQSKEVRIFIERVEQ